MLDVDGLWETYHHIRKLREAGHDERGNYWDQGVWGSAPEHFTSVRNYIFTDYQELCGTGQCYAGWYVTLKGYQVDGEGFTLNHGQPIRLDRVTCKLSGIDDYQAGMLFSYPNSLEDIGNALIHITGEDRRLSPVRGNPADVSCVLPGKRENGRRLFVLNIPEVAASALEILDRDGWNQGALTLIYPGDGFRKGSHCAAGAANLALSDDADSIWIFTPEAEFFYGKLASAMKEIDPVYFGYSGRHSESVYIAEWNNSHSEEQVRSAFRRLIPDSQDSCFD